MKRAAIFACAALAVWGTAVHADEATEQEVIETLLEANEYTKTELKGMEDTIAADGSLEFWSSGGLLNEVPADASVQEFESFNTNLKHITVITLVPGKAAVAQFYSEGSMEPVGNAPVAGYRVRVTQVMVKEDGKWKVRAAHWSPIAGGAGITQTALDD